MKILLLVVALLVMVTVGGCSTPVVGSDGGVNVEMSALPSGQAVAGDDEIIGLIEAKVWVGSDFGMFAKGYHPGEHIEHDILISNGYSVDKRVLLEFYTPGIVTDAVGSDALFSPAPEYASDWVVFADDDFIIPANTVVGIPVTFQMPKNATVVDEYGIPATNWEFRIRVMEADQGMVKHAVGQRWLITMR